MGILNLCVFGSALREDFDPNSDIDIPVNLDPNRVCSLAGLLKIEWELEELYGRDVDVDLREAIDSGDDSIRKINN